MTPREQALRDEAFRHRQHFRSWRKHTRSGGLPKGFLTKEFRTFLPADQLGPMALRIYIHLLLLATDGGEAWPKAEAIADDLGASVRQIQRGLAELEEKQLVARVKYSQKSRTRFFLLPYGFVAAEQREEQV